MKPKRRTRDARVYLGDAKRRRKLLAEVAIRIWPDLGVVMLVGRNAAYELVRAGDVPSVRVGRTLVVPCEPLREMFQSKQVPGPIGALVRAGLVTL